MVQQAQASPRTDFSKEGEEGEARRFLVELVDAAIPGEMQTDPDVLRRARTVVGLTLALIVLGLEAIAFFAWAIPGDSWQRVAAALVVALAMVGAIPVAFRRFGSLALGANLMIGGSWLVIVSCFTVSGGIHAPLLHWCALMPLLAVLMGAPRSAFVWLTVGVLTVCGFAALDSIGIQVQDEAGLAHSTGPILWVQRLIDVSSWLGILLAVALVYESQRKQQTERLATKNADLEVQVQHRAEAEARNRYLAYYDELTTLPNRRLFEEHLTIAIGHAMREGRQVAVMFLDLDGFKAVNDTLGHGSGDQLLAQVAQRLRSCLRLSDTVARGCDESETGTGEDLVSRRGGDEFTILLSEIRDHREAALVADRVLRALADAYFVGEQEVSISASIGIALHSGGIGPFGCSDLLRNADLAMYHAKDCGRNNFQFFENWMTEDTLERGKLSAELRRGIDCEELEIYYQPIVRPLTHECVGAEALARWHHPQRGLLPAAEFIEVAEESGLAVALGEWAIRTVARDYSKWLGEGVAPPRVAVNVSVAQLRRGTLTSLVSHALREHPMPPAALELELTEGAMMIDVEDASQCLNALKELGVSIALDDFGTGYSSLSFVKQFPVDRLKIDRSFVKDVEADREAQAITTAILAMARQLGLAVVAEGVETEAQERFLQSHGCEEIQGFLVGRPMPAAAFAELMRTGHAPEMSSAPMLPARKGE